MTTQTIKLELQPREVQGKKVKRLRQSGIIPVHLYGPGVESRSLQCRGPTLIQVLATAGGNTPILVTIEGEQDERLAFAREIQWDPRRDTIFHVDLLVAQANRPVTAQVPVVLVGESSGARMVGGSIVHQLQQLQVEALPLEMPAQAEADLEVLTEADAVIRVRDIPMPSNVTVLNDPDELVVRIELPRAEVEEEEAVEVEGAEEQPAAEDAPAAEEDSG